MVIDQACAGVFVCGAVVFMDETEVSQILFFKILVEPIEEYLETLVKCRAIHPIERAGKQPQAGFLQDIRHEACIA
jgi:hypothetical protein